MIVAREPAFDVRFVATHRFPGVVWLDPVPAQPFLRLTQAIWAAFPDHPPYGGAFGRVVPHLTVAQLEDARVMASVETLVQPLLPIAATARRVDVMATGPDGRWHVRWRLPLGARADGRYHCTAAQPSSSRRPIADHTEERLSDAAAPACRTR